MGERINARELERLKDLGRITSKAKNLSAIELTDRMEEYFKKYPDADNVVLNVNGHYLEFQSAVRSTFEQNKVNDGAQNVNVFNISQEGGKTQMTQKDLLEQGMGAISKVNRVREAGQQVVDRLSQSVDIQR